MTNQNRLIDHGSIESSHWLSGRRKIVENAGYPIKTGPLYFAQTPRNANIVLLATLCIATERGCGGAGLYEPHPAQDAKSSVIGVFPLHVAGLFTANSGADKIVIRPCCRQRASGDNAGRTGCHHKLRSYLHHDDTNEQRMAIKPTEGKSPGVRRSKTLYALDKVIEWRLSVGNEEISIASLPSKQALQPALIQQHVPSVAERNSHAQWQQCAHSVIRNHIRPLMVEKRRRTGSPCENDQLLENCPNASVNQRLG